MTCYEKYKTEYFLPVKGCPYDYGYMPKPDDCYEISCTACWEREIPGTEDEEGA